MLWPIIASGFTPQLIHNFASAYSTANSAGCVTAVCVSSGSAGVSPACCDSEKLAGETPALPGNITARKSNPSCGLRISQHKSTCSRKTISCS